MPEDAALPDPFPSAAGPSSDEARRAADALLPRLRRRFRGDEARWAVFERRVRRHLPRLAATLEPLYGGGLDFAWVLEDLLATAGDALARRPAWLAEADAAAEAAEEAGAQPWFRDHRQVAAVCYVDRFAGDLGHLRRRLPWLEALGVTYLHLMPLLRARPGENDGGYAVSSYREVEPVLGTMAELSALAREVRRHGMRICLDLVLNHTSEDHGWALAAKAGDREKRGYYRVFDDRTMPDRLEPTLREIFPDRGPQHFTWDPELGGWVWTTFYTYQWDLNFANPALFRQMAEEMLFLANQGIGVLRLDAVPFLWKREGTACENLDEAHAVVRALNAVARIAAPELVFKSEAIVHPDEVVRYVGPGEAQLSYFPLLMVLIWEALATRDTRLARHSLIKRLDLPAGTGWVTYVRCHDDIGWGFADEDAAELGIHGPDHRRFLNEFYTGRFPGSFARGLPFQENERTGDCRICGTTASLCGLEAALEAGDAAAVDLAVARILMIHGIIATIGGIPLLYLGDEIGMLNDEGWRQEPGRSHDARWAHRPEQDWAAAERAAVSPDSPAGRILGGLRRLVALRRSQPRLGAGETEILPVANPAVLAWRRGPEADPLVVLASFSENPQPVADGGLAWLLGPGAWIDAATGAEVTRDASGALVLPPYGFLVLCQP